MSKLIETHNLLVATASAMHLGNLLAKDLERDLRKKTISDEDRGQIQAALDEIAEANQTLLERGNQLRRELVKIHEQEITTEMIHNISATPKSDRMEIVIVFNGQSYTRHVRGHYGRPIVPIPGVPYVEYPIKSVWSIDGLRQAA